MSYHFPKVLMFPLEGNKSNCFPTFTSTVVTEAIAGMNQNS